ncbi:MAG: hypothetical protein JXA93_02720, partial [Anaerolineae bacterium]|nr:hypothetical protein [Anaerolineae bacterium]
TEIDNLGFNLYRSDRASGPYTRLNDALIPSQAPGLPSGGTYTWVDSAVDAGIAYYYRLESVDVRGHYLTFGPVSATLPDPSAWRVYLPLVTRR